MRYNKPHKPMDEREKLRKFRELDDAFAAALQKLDKTTTTTHADVTAIDVVSSEERKQQRESERQRIFEQRLTELMDEYQLASGSVMTLLKTLIKFEKIT